MKLFLLDSNDQIAVSEAKAKKLQKWSGHDIYTEVDNKGQDYTTTWWVITEKFMYNRKVKARLVACGFEEEDLSTLCKDSPTCGKENIQVFLPLQFLWNGK